MKTWDPRAPSPTNAIESASAADAVKGCSNLGCQQGQSSHRNHGKLEGVASAKPPPISSPTFPLNRWETPRSDTQVLHGCVHDKGQLVDGLRRPAGLARFRKIEQKSQNRPAPFAPPHLDVFPQSSLGAGHGINPGGLQKLLQVKQAFPASAGSRRGSAPRLQVYGEHRGQIGGENLFANEHAALRITNHVVPQKIDSCHSSTPVRMLGGKMRSNATGLKQWFQRLVGLVQFVSSGSRQPGSDVLEKSHRTPLEAELRERIFIYAQRSRELGERLLRWGTSGKSLAQCERVWQNGSVRWKDDRQLLPRTNVEHRVLGNLNFGLERDRLKSRRFAPPALSEAHKG